VVIVHHHFISVFWNQYSVFIPFFRFDFPRIVHPIVLITLSEAV